MKKQLILSLSVALLSIGTIAKADTDTFGIQNDIAQNYGHIGKTKSQVLAELVQAEKNGEVPMPDYKVFSTNTNSTKTRTQVINELVQYENSNDFKEKQDLYRN